MLGLSNKQFRTGCAPRRSVSLIALCAGLLASPAFAAGTEAGTLIENTATATFSLPGGGSGSVNSNTVTTVVDKLLDVTVAWSDPSEVLVYPDGINQVLTFEVTNTGNYNEAFSLTTQIGGGFEFDPAVTTIVIDNGNGVYEPGLDLVYQPGVNDPLIEADQTIVIFVLSSIPGGAGDQQTGNVILIASSTTATGVPGTVAAAPGPNGSQVVIGSSGGSAQDDGIYLVNSATVSLVKSASVSDPFGGTTQVPGSIITYSLLATVSGTGTISGLKIQDAIPAGTSYKNNSLTLQGANLTDTMDSDAGEYVAGSGISVDLGDLAASSNRTVTFQVVINAN